MNDTKPGNNIGTNKKEYYEANKEHLLQTSRERNKERFTCECGIEMRLDSI